MSTVGDLILTVRRKIPDLPGVMGAPTSITLTAVQVPGGVIPNGATFYVKGTALTGVAPNYWGETTPTAEQSITVNSPNNAIQVTFNGVKAAASFVRAYYQAASNTQDRWEGIAVNGTSMTPGVVTILDVGAIAGAVPTRNTALQPDTDGNFISVAGLYELLNEGLDELIRVGNGIEDITGVQAINGQLAYRLTSNFFNFTDIWSDGYVIEVVPRRAIFLRNSVPGTAGYASVEHDGTSHVINFWPQPSRSGLVSALNGAITATQSSVPLDTGSFSSTPLSMGLVQIDNEIIEYSSIDPTGSILQQCLRGVGGTLAVAHSDDAVVTELNIRLAGRRMAGNFAPGQATMPLNVPPAWDRALFLYVMSQIRQMEQQDAEAKSLLADFERQVNLLTKMSKQQTRPRQIMADPEWPETYNWQIGGGWIVN